MTTSVLLVDDSPIARSALRRALPDDWDVRIEEVADGVEALQRYRAGEVDVMFLDLVMPRMDGYQVLKTLQSEGLNCCVIVVSAETHAGVRARVLALGAIAFLRKPINPLGLREALREYGVRV